MKTTIVTTIETRWIRKAKQNYKLMTWPDAQLHTTGRAGHNNTSWNSTAAENSRLSWPDAHVRQVTHHRTRPLSKNPLWSLSVRDRTPSLGASGHALSSASGQKMNHSHSANTDRTWKLCVRSSVRSHLTLNNALQKLQQLAYATRRPQKKFGSIWLILTCYTKKNRWHSWKLKIA